MLQSRAFIRLVAIRAVCEPNANSTIANGYHCDWDTSCRGFQGVPCARAMYSGTYPARGRQTSVLNDTGCKHDRFTLDQTCAVTHSGTYPARGSRSTHWHRRRETPRVVAGREAAITRSSACVTYTHALADGSRPVTNTGEPADMGLVSYCVKSQGPTITHIGGNRRYGSSLRSGVYLCVGPTYM